MLVFPKVVYYLDEILVAGVDNDDHLNSLSQVFEKLSAAGSRLKKAKCELEKTSVQYLGHVIDGEGVHPTDEKLAAVCDASKPTNVTSLKSFLELVMFYSRITRQF